MAHTLKHDRSGAHHVEKTTVYQEMGGFLTPLRHLIALHMQSRTSVNMGSAQQVILS